MTVGRRPSTPPVLAGYEVRRLIGMGGFADVFLYEQQHPRRPVAVKVLLADTLDPEVRERFATEADLTAQLSHHPSIVTVHQAAVAADGRPYLVMEHCSRPGLGALYRTERTSVAEVLRIGVRLASAVETAHRAGILHRDIKPANVLVTDFGWPALTDFGIAATTGWSRGSAVGMSIPWSPPELLAESPTGDVRGDVYSLAATLYSVLAGRSPFEVPGGANGAADLVARIERAPLPATGRADVPASLQAALARAMEKNPVRRFHSALALGRALQAVERELMLPGTPLELADDARTVGPVGPHAAPATGGADDATRRRPVVTIDPDGASAAPAPSAAVRTPEQEAAEETRVRPVPVIRPEGAEPSAVAGTGSLAGPLAGPLSRPLTSPLTGPLTDHGTGPEVGGGAGDHLAPAVPLRTQARPTVPGESVPGDGGSLTVPASTAPAASVPPSTEPASTVPSSTGPSSTVPGRTAPGVAATPGAVPTGAPVPGGPTTGPRPRHRRAVAAAAAVVVVGALAGAAALSRPATPVAAASVADPATGSVEGPATGSVTGSVAGSVGDPVPAVVTAVPSPGDLTVVPQADGSLAVTWSNPQPQDGDRYLWGVAGATSARALVDQPSAVVPPGAARPLCVEVSIVRHDRRASTLPAVGCAP